MQPNYIKLHCCFLFSFSYLRRGESHWWMKGSTPTQISEIIIKLIKDMAAVSNSYLLMLLFLALSQTMAKSTCVCYMFNSNSLISILIYWKAVEFFFCYILWLIFTQFNFLSNKSLSRTNQFSVLTVFM